MSLMVDTGDSMMRTHSMKLPGKTPYELQARQQTGFTAGNSFTALLQMMATLRVCKF
jgi:hypothetical protein